MATEIDPMPKAYSTTTSLGLFLLRLHAGVSMASGGYDKVPTPDWFVEQVGNLGWPLPAFFASCASIAEYVGAIFLVLGLLTRSSAVFLTITMAVAAFQLQEIRSLTTINVAHLYFWVFLMFVFTGAGDWSLDRCLSGKNTSGSVKQSWIRRIGVGAIIATCVLGMAYRKSPQAPSTTATNDITTVSVAGSFNDWDITANPLEQSGEGTWSAEVEFAQESAIQFKFVANESWDNSGGEEDQPAQPFPAEGKLELGNSAKNISMNLPSAGRYRFEFRAADLSYSVKPATAP